MHTSSQPGLAQPTRLKVLVIDDHADYAASVAELIRSWGHVVEIAYNAVAAQEIARSFRPRVIMLDLGLPDMEGYELAKTLRREAKGRRIFIIVVTGWTKIADQMSSTAAGISHHLLKPVNLESLRRILAGYEELEKARLTSSNGGAREASAREANARSLG